MKIFNVAIAGYGVVGKRRHFYIDKNPKMKVIAICDKTFIKNKPKIENTLKVCVILENVDLLLFI